MPLQTISINGCRFIRSTILALSLPLAFFTSLANAGEITTHNYPAWRSAAIRSAPESQSTGPITVESTDSPYPFRLRARAGVWFAAPSGDFRFGNRPSDVSLENHLDLNDPDPSFTGDITIDFPGQDDHWLLWFDMFDTSQDANAVLPVNTRVNGTIIAQGTTVRSSFSSTSFGAHVGYDLFDNLLSQNKPDSAGPDAVLRIHAISGLRAFHLDQSYRALGTGVNGSYDEWHGIIEVGGRVSILLTPSHRSRGSFDLSLNMTGGYGFSDGNLTTFDLFTAITWIPTEHLGITAGFRSFNVNLDNVAQSNGKPFEFQGKLAGFFLGGELRF